MHKLELAPLLEDLNKVAHGVTRREQ
jgi:hypothetical protein